MMIEPPETPQEPPETHSKKESPQCPMALLEHRGAAVPSTFDTSMTLEDLCGEGFVVLHNRTANQEQIPSFTLTAMTRRS